MRKTFVLLLHAGYWLTYLLLLAVVFSLASLRRGAPHEPSSLLPLYPLVLLCLVPNLLSFYGSYHLLFTKFLARRRIAALVAAVALLSALAAAAGGLLAVALFGLDQPITTDARESLNLSAVLFAVAALHAVLALVLRGFVDWYGELRVKEELTRRSYELELELIRSRLSPHFLFNTINNIDVLIARDAARASAYLNKLSGVLRYQLYGSRARRVPLAEELGFVEQYVELQRIRTANQSYVSYSVRGETRGRRVAPLVLAPFIENAFKHTEHDRQANSISVEIVVKDGALLFVCENTCRGGADAKRGDGGLGSELISQRLRLLYPDRHTLEVKESGGVYRVELTLELNGD